MNVFGLRRVARIADGQVDEAAVTITEQDLTTEHLSDERGSAGRRPKDCRLAAPPRGTHLSTVLNWACGRGKFRQVGTHRDPKLTLIDMRNVVDPSKDDPTIVGERKRVLDEIELGKVLPRRSAATLARVIGCDPAAIDAALGHENPLAETNVSASASAYMVITPQYITFLIRSNVREARRGAGCD